MLPILLDVKRTGGLQLKKEGAMTERDVEEMQRSRNGGFQVDLRDRW